MLTPWSTLVLTLARDARILVLRDYYGIGYLHGLMDVIMTH